ncbi:putative C6 transcription factor [Dendryphion nanum]|uniref:C6 transcription factor n=1 Tax=Dendryphion nanum TaxID=256645 RepID=A0A9P9ICK4_9PLEO|nr:putative C6 transcription factor [Dendryphion nanum]
MSNIETSAPKRRRITRACDFCHRRGRKCLPAEGESVGCQTCINHNVVCTWDRIAAKRGAKTHSETSIPLATGWILIESRHGSREFIESLINVFFGDVYPIICTVHESTFRSNWNNDLIPMGPSSYSRLLSICALSAQRIISDLEGLQSVHLLCVAAMELGNASLLHKLMGSYHAIVAHQGLADENRWPLDISLREREERRRLFWHMYRLEVHTSLILGHVIRLPETQVAVEYPHDWTFDSDDGNADTEWLTGWNFVTDLYRGLEHLLVYFRSNKERQHFNLDRPFFATGVLDSNTKLELLNHLNTAYICLPRRFKEGTEKSGDIGRNRCVYQTANIICTYQLLKMFSYASGKVTFREACDTVLELVEGISAIPAEFLRSMSLAMIQELSGFGHLLTSFIGKDMSIEDYQELKAVMLCMSELLQCLVTSIPTAEEAVQRVTTYLERIDEIIQHASALTSHLDYSETSSTFISAHWALPSLFEDLSWPDFNSIDYDDQSFHPELPLPSASQFATYNTRPPS